MLADLIHDLRFAVRGALNAPLPFLVAALSIGVGIGANTVVYTWLDNLVFHPLPAVPDADRLVAFNWAATTGATGGVPPFSYPALQGWREAARSFDGMAAEGVTRLMVRHPEATGGESAWGMLTTANYFAVVGVSAMLGRTFAPDEEATAAAVVVVSEPFWRRFWGADSSAIGRRLVVNGVDLTVVGVAQPKFVGVTAGLGFDLWIPLGMQPYLSTTGNALQDRSQRWLRGVARLRPGTTVAEANRELSEIASRQSTEAGERPVTSASVERFRDQQLGSLLLPLLGAVLVVTVLVLLLACANVANLLLARASARRREIAVRLAIGAGRGRLTRQLMTESLFLALVGGVIAIALTMVVKGSFAVFVPPVPEPVTYSLDLNPTVITIAAALTLATALLFGLAPALEATRPDVITTLRTDRGGGRRGGRARSALVIGQLVFSTAALFAAGLFIRSLDQARRTDLGIGDPSRLLLISTDVAALRVPPAEADVVLDQVLARLRDLPGVTAVGGATSLPLGFGGHQSAPIAIDGYLFGPEEPNEVERVSVTPGYFDAMGVAIVRGRAIDGSDWTTTSGVAVVNEAFVRRYWPGLDPIGRHLKHGPLEATVVGVARDGRYDSPGAPPYPLVYTPWRQWYRAGLTILVRTEDEPARLTESARSVVRAVHADLPFLDPRTMADHIQASTFVQRLGGSVLGVLGVVALLLASLGLFAVLAHEVTERTQEIGVRLALGQSAARVERDVLRRSARLVGIGLGVGTVAALGLGQAFRSQLIGVSPFDPVVLGVIGLALTGTAGLASWLPARRAARVDPLVALRS